MKIGLISDSLTYECLSRIAVVNPITPFNYKWNLWYRRPDILLVESAWQGYGQRWKYRIASYPDYPKRNNSALERVVKYAQKLKIPTIFWNKEDGVHFDRFIESARLFEYVFTVDETCIPRYRAALGSSVPVNTLMFPIEPSIHKFEKFEFKYKTANFVGSYGTHVHPGRRKRQDLLLEACSESGLGAVVFDRNSKRTSKNYRFPVLPGVEIRPGVKHTETSAIYKQYLVSLNVNTVETSATMYSRRLIEILACGGIAVTTPSDSVSRLFSKYCHVVDTKDNCMELFERLKMGPSMEDLDRAREGADYVAKNHTWRQRLDNIYAIVGL